MTISYWLDEPQKQSRNYDMIVIGAGIAGLSTAYWLERNHPNVKIAVIDKNSLGFGASGRNAGFLTCGSAEHFYRLQKQFGFEKATEIWKFSEHNRELLKSEIINGQPESIDYFTTGSCTVASTEEDWARYQILAQDMRRAQIDVELVNEKYLSENYGVRSSQGAIHYKQDAALHPLKLLNRIKSKLQRTDFFWGEEVFRISTTSFNVEVQTQKNKFSSAKIFVCVNGYLNSLVPEMREHLRPQRGQALLTESLPSFVKGPCYLTKHLCYFRQLPTGELLVGGFRNHDLEAENTSLDEVSDKIQNALTDFVTNYFKNLGPIRVQYRWSGTMAFSKDEQMIIGEHPDRKNLYLMAGCAGHGMGLSFNAARVLVENANGATVPSHLDIKRIHV